MATNATVAAHDGFDPVEEIEEMDDGQALFHPGMIPSRFIFGVPATIDASLARTRIFEWAQGYHSAVD
jgi:hypothetical protein